MRQALFSFVLPQQPVPFVHYFKKKSLKSHKIRKKFDREAAK